MPSVLAIVSRAVFEKTAPAANVGDRVDVDRYVSSNAAFAYLGKRDAIFLVTVRPPRESLWLVGIVEAPKRRGSSWIGRANKTKIADVTAAIGRLALESGKGIEARKGALAMSLQTPRVLAPRDVDLLRKLAGGKTVAPDAVAPLREARKAPKWSSLRVSHGSAMTIPSLVRALRTDKRSDAIDKLASMLVHRNKVFSASGPAIAELLLELEKGDLEERERVLQLVMHVFLFGDGSWFQELVFARKIGALAKRHTGVAAEVLRAAVGGTPTYLRLLRDANPKVRAEAVFALAHVGSADCAEHVAAQLASERVPAVQAGCAVACVYLACRHPSTTRAMIEALDRVKANADPLPRGLAFAAACFLDDRKPDGNLDRMLTAFFRATLALREGTTLWIGGREGPTTPFRWNAGAADLIVLRMLGEGSHAEKWWPILARAMVAAIPDAHPASPARWDWPTAVLRWCFRPRELDDNPMLAKELTKTQRQLLEILSTRGIAQKFGNYSPFVHFGLPSDLRSRRRMLGLAKPGVMEETVRIAGRSMPRWRAIAKIFSEYDELRESRKPLLSTYLAERLKETPRRLLDVWTEIEAHAYFLDAPYDPHPGEPILQAMDPIPTNELRDWAFGILDETLETPDEDFQRRLGYIALVALCRREQTWPARYDGLIGPFGIIQQLAEVCAALPPARRNPVLERFKRDDKSRYNDLRSAIRSASRNLR